MGWKCLKGYRSDWGTQRDGNPNDWSIQKTRRLVGDERMNIVVAAADYNGHQSTPKKNKEEESKLRGKTNAVLSYYAIRSN